VLKPDFSPVVFPLTHSRASELWAQICADYTTTPDDSEARLALVLLHGFMMLENRLKEDSNA
jgi:uncharacterized protein (DUF2126 family)